MADRKMPNWHSVLDKNKEVLYTGSPFETSLWLEGITDFEAANIHWVRIAKTGEVQSIKDYMDGAKPKQHNVGDVIQEEIAKQVEGRLRRIVREELKSLLESMGKTAYNSDGYETGELESAGLRAIRTVVEAEGSHLPHAWTCPKRQGTWDREGYATHCNCGVGEDD
ncbi:hypothetical protein [Streptomyces phage Psst4]|nr:hypothetical protein [Streptomyces phage Psst4]